MPPNKTQRGPASTLWAREPHTKAKHDLIQRYLGGWFPVLGRFNGRILFLDGFAGPGTYSESEMGSPLLAIETLLDHPLFSRYIKTEFVFLFCEPEHDRASALTKTLADFFEARGGQPTNVKVDVDEATFVEKATELTAIIDEQKKRLAPTFAFIDPFGFSGVPIELISRLLAFDKCEVFFNFMVDFVNRFATAGNVDHHLDDIFGTRDYVNACNYPAGDERRAFLLDLYARQLKAIGGFPYIQRFDMFNRQRHNTYSMFHGTRNLAGVRLMKSAMWAVDPVSGSRFSDREANPKLDLSIAVNVDPLRYAILDHFAGKNASVEEVEAFTLTETNYSASHYNRLVLAPLEREGVITVTSSIRAKRFSFPAGTRIQFPGT